MSNPESQMGELQLLKSDFLHYIIAEPPLTEVELKLLPEPLAISTDKPHHNRRANVYQVNNIGTVIGRGTIIGFGQDIFENDEGLLGYTERYAHALGTRTVAATVDHINPDAQ